jgi:hypothetical protein
MWSLGIISWRKQKEQARISPAKKPLISNVELGGLKVGFFVVRLNNFSFDYKIKLLLQKRLKGFVKLN